MVRQLFVAVVLFLALAAGFAGGGYGAVWCLDRLTSYTDRQNEEQKTYLMQVRYLKDLDLRYGPDAPDSAIPPPHDARRREYRQAVAEAEATHTK